MEKFDVIANMQDEAVKVWEQQALKRELIEEKYQKDKEIYEESVASREKMLKCFVEEETTKKK